MNIHKAIESGVGVRLAVLAFLIVFVSACATTQPSPQGSVEVRNKLTALQNNPHLGDKARVEMREAEEAVRLAEIKVPRNETHIGEHRVYMAERKVAIAEAKAKTQYAEAQRAQLIEQREDARLQARTREADRARSDAEQAKTDAARARADTEQARAEAIRARAATDQATRDAEMARVRAEEDAARIRREAAAEKEQSSAESAREAAALQKRIDELQAEATDRGLVLTLGDVLFATGSAELRAGTNERLSKLVEFLNQYPERTALIEGHTDNVGNAGYNQDLSTRRAQAVRSYLIRQGITSRRLSASGLGMEQPIASNDNAVGRQQNRRVEIIIENIPNS